MATIYLMGYMGSGKSTLGRKIANLLNYNFIDLDEEIEKKAGVSIEEIFEREGEKYFRRLESEQLAATAGKKDTVISLGGGTPCSNENIEFIKKHGFSIYINLPAKALYQRLTNAKIKRPLLKNISGNKLLEFIDKQLKERELYYEQADYIVDIHHNSAKDIVARLNEVL